jgi:predicted ATPase/DNA-binding winged helix-turn-helix (wHTH) protein
VDDAAFTFGPFRLHPAERLLLKEGKPLRLGSRALEVLVTLVECAGETVLKDQLLGRVWPDTIVDEGALRVHVAALRKALGDGRDGNRFISNIPGRGYSFVAPVTREQRQEAAAPPSRPALGGNLPAQLIRVIGRGDIIATAVSRLSQHRLLTIVGPGGIGKTTVALATAEATGAFCPDGVWFIGLSTIIDAALVPGAVGATLGMPPSNIDPLTALGAWLGGKHLLIVLDCCEHVVGAAAAIAEAVLRRAPGVRILATSREPLRAESEWLLRLPSLQVPSASTPLSATEALGFAAVELFNERATAAVEDFVLSDNDVPYILEICRRLDGMPLALELAAAQIDVFGVKGLAARLEDRLAVLTRGRRTALPRHQTLRAAIDWSYTLLAEPERVVLRRLAVFAGAFSLAAASAVATNREIPTSQVLDGLSSLVAKSLVAAEVDASVTHYRLLDTMRAYVLEKLDESGEREPLARRHAEYYRDVFERAEAEWEARPTAEWLAEYGWRINNLRAALDWAFSLGGDASIGVALATAAVPLWMSLSLMHECRSRVKQALAVLGAEASRDAPRRMKLYAALATSLNYTRGQAPETVEAWSGALAAAEQLDDTEHRLQALYGLWNSRATSGDVAAAMDFARQFHRLAAERSHADVLMGGRMLGSMLHFSGEQTDARHHLETMLDGYVPPVHRTATMRHQFDQRIVARALLARVCWMQGFPDQATTLAATALEHALATDHDNAVCYSLIEGACPVALFTGDLALAKRLVSQLLDRSAQHGLTTWQVIGLSFEGELLIRCGDIAIGLPRLRTAVEAVNERRLLLRLPALLGVLAEGYALAGRVSEAAAAIEQALAESERTGVRWCQPELLRINGLVAQLDGDGSGRTRAEEAFLQALELSRHQGSLAWQLRAAMSLARLWTREGRSRDARELVRAIYEVFTEGFQTRDLLEARALIDPAAPLGGAATARPVGTRLQARC